MHLPFCYQATHPTIALVLKELERRPQTAAELAKRLNLKPQHIRGACEWMHKRGLIKIALWVMTSVRVSTRVWGLPDGKPDAARRLNIRKLKEARKRERAASSTRRLTPIVS